ncbi:MAG: hypothetical protein ACKVP7_20180 [Hyphomicrobiaceae bacterium]
MNIALTKDRADWLQSLVDAGRFASIEDALEAALAALSSDLDHDDNWAKPAIDEAIAALDNGAGRPWTKGETLKTLHGRHAGLVRGKTG